MIIIRPFSGKLLTLDNMMHAKAVPNIHELAPGLHYMHNMHPQFVETLCKDNAMQGKIWRI